MADEEYKPLTFLSLTIYALLIILFGAISYDLISIFY